MRVLAAEKEQKCGLAGGLEELDWEQHAPAMI